MTKFWILSAGLIVAGMLTTPLMARENFMTKPHAAECAQAGLFPASRCIDSHLWIPAPRVSPSAAAPSGQQPGEICDFGDNPMIC